MTVRSKLEEFIPDSSEDPIMRLHDYYFQPCIVMHDHLFKNLEKLKQRKRSSINHMVEIQSFLSVWLSMLYVVAEGFQDKKLRAFFESTKHDRPDTIIYWSSINHQIGQLGDKLRVYRNKSFHYQDSEQLIIDSRENFFKNQLNRAPIGWAKSLHREMDRFFSSYKVESIVLNFMKKG